MSTLAVMKARIADELGRDDITSQIAYAITDAIGAYEAERWYFNETRALTFSTVADQEFYDSDDQADIANIVKIDYLAIYVGDIPTRLRATTPAEIELMSQNGTNTGTPYAYCFYSEQIRLYPTPATALTVRIGAVVKTSAPATDGTTGNAWMTKAERLIRSRAKLELAMHVLYDNEMATTLSQAVNEAYDQLRDRTNALTQIEDGRIEAMEF